MQATELLMHFEEPLKDYVRAVQSIKVSLIFLLILWKAKHLPETL